MREFTRCAQKYDGHPEKVLKWCKDLEHHLFKHKWGKKTKQKCEMDAVVLHHRINQERDLSRRISI